MPNSLRQPNHSAHRVLPDTRGSMLKADVRKADGATSDLVWRVAVGRMIEAVRRGQGLTLDEFAGKLKKDPRQIGRWEKGIEHAQFDVILAVPDFHQPLLLAFAKLLEVETTIQISLRA